tara:strand:+ start:3261 stop:4283 length:1023 start_codon:yes stop_codon:yes gene_type:complete
MYNPFKFFTLTLFFIGFLFLFNGSYLFLNTIINQKNISKFTIKDFEKNEYFGNKYEHINSSQVNYLYSEKEIKYNDPSVSKKITNNLIVKIKSKPINPSIIKHIKLENNYSNIVKNKKLDLNHFSSKKQEFIKTVLPLISYENQKIILERTRLENFRKQLVNNKTLKNDNLNHLYSIAKKYKIKYKNKHKLDLVNELLVVVDIIPNSIVLAQAANESGWGKSRFAKEYNAIFGEYTYDFSKGVVPLNREHGENHLVKAFSSIDKSVQSYFRNINTHNAYRDFRKVRKLMRDKNNFANIDLLISKLDTYAADENYTKIISSIIKTNNLKNFDFINYSVLSL